MSSSKEKFIAKVPRPNFSDGIDMLKDFSQEVQRHLIAIRNMLLVLETMPSDKEAIGEVYKTFHTIRGMSNFLMLDDIFVLTGEVEKLMDLARKDIVILDTPDIELVTNAVQSLQKLLELLDEQIHNEGMLQSPYHDIAPLVASLEEITRKKFKIAHQPKTTIGDIPTIQF